MFNADASLEILTPAQTIQKLRQNEFESLDLYLNRVQQAHEAQNISEADLAFAFSAFGSGFQTLGPKIQQWMEDIPGSYPAHVALSQWFIGQAWRHRGGATYNHVSDRGRRGMQFFLERAEGCAEFSLDLTEKPLLSVLVLADVNITRGNQLSLEDLQNRQYPEWYRQGVGFAPQSFLLRQHLLLTLRTEWGGSDGHMLAFIRSQENDLFSTDHQKLWAQFNAQVAHHAFHFQQDTAKAMEHIEHALQLNPLYVYDQVYYLAQQQQQAKAEFVLLRALREDAKNPRFRLNSKALHILADVVQSTDVPLEWLYTFLRETAEGGNLTAHLVLGQLLENCKSLRASESPAHWYVRALEEGETNAGHDLIDYGLAARLPRETRMAHVLQAAEAGNALCAALVWENFKLYQKAHGLEDRDLYTHLLRAADNGDALSQLELAKRIKAGKVDLGDDGVLRPIQGKPTRSNLDYAAHLIERAGQEKPDRAQLQSRRELSEAIHGTGAPAWMELGARDVQVLARLPWLLLFFLAWIVFRAWSTLSSHPVGMGGST